MLEPVILKILMKRMMMREVSLKTLPSLRSSLVEIMVRLVIILMVLCSNILNTLRPPAVFQVFNVTRHITVPPDNHGQLLERITLLAELIMVPTHMQDHPCAKLLADIDDERAVLAQDKEVNQARLQVQDYWLGKRVE